MQLLRIHYQKLFVCLSFVMLVLVFVRVWDANDGSRGPRQTLPASLKSPEKSAASARENSINIDSPVLPPIRPRGHDSIKTNVFADLFQDITKVSVFIIHPTFSTFCLCYYPISSIGFLRSQSHICILSYFFLILPQDPSKQRCLWHFASVNLGNLRRY